MPIRDDKERSFEWDVSGREQGIEKEQERKRKTRVVVPNQITV